MQLISIPLTLLVLYYLVLKLGGTKYVVLGFFIGLFAILYSFQTVTLIAPEISLIEAFPKEPPASMPSFTERLMGYYLVIVPYMFVTWAGGRIIDTIVNKKSAK